MSRRDRDYSHFNNFDDVSFSEQMLSKNRPNSAPAQAKTHMVAQTTSTKRVVREWRGAFVRFARRFPPTSQVYARFEAKAGAPLAGCKPNMSVFAYDKSRELLTTLDLLEQLIGLEPISGNYEEEILTLHETKRDLVAGILDGTHSAAKLSTNDLIELLRS